VLLIQNTPVKEVTPLTTLNNLKELNLNSTQVKDVMCLAGSKNLESLHLYGTPVSEEQIDALQEALPNCEISYD
jgi:Leucine-rich repeat (LRR) protein